METGDYLRFLQKEIHTAVFATLDENGLPQTCVIDLMLSDADGLYFLTAKGKSFYDRLERRPFVALSGIKGKDTLSAIAVSVRGYVRETGGERLAEIFAENPYMEKIYPTEKSREALTVFQLYQGEGEYFDLSRLPPFRQSFSFGGFPLHNGGYRIEEGKCVGCQSCLDACPAGCISERVPRRIDPDHCLHCGNCMAVCPARAVEKMR